MAASPAPLKLGLNSERYFTSINQWANKHQWHACQLVCTVEFLSLRHGRHVQFRAHGPNAINRRKHPSRPMKRPSRTVPPISFAHPSTSLTSRQILEIISFKKNISSNICDEKNIFLPEQIYTSSKNIIQKSLIFTAN